MKRVILLSAMIGVMALTSGCNQASLEEYTPDQMSDPAVGTIVATA